MGLRAACRRDCAAGFDPLAGSLGLGVWGGIWLGSYAFVAIGGSGREHLYDLREAFSLTVKNFDSMGRKRSRGLLAVHFLFQSLFLGGFVFF